MNDDQRLEMHLRNMRRSAAARLFGFGAGLVCVGALATAWLANWFTEGGTIWTGAGAGPLAMIVGGILAVIGGRDWLRERAPTGGSPRS